MKVFRGKSWRTLSYQVMPNGQHNPTFLERLRVERDNFNMIAYDRKDGRVYIAYDEYNPSMIADVLSEPSVDFMDSVPIMALPKAGGLLDMDQVLTPQVLDDEGEEVYPEYKIGDVATLMGTSEDGDGIYEINVVAIPHYHIFSQFVDWVSNKIATQWIIDNVPPVEVDVEGEQEPEVPPEDQA